MGISSKKKTGLLQVVGRSLPAIFGDPDADRLILTAFQWD